MQIEKYILELLIKHEKAIVPKFGLFFNNYSSAHFNIQSFKITPPQTKIGFNSQVLDDKGTFSIYVSQKENINYDEAINKINEIVEQWLHILNSYDTLILKGIGSLKKNSYNGIDINSTENDFNPQYGLSEIRGNHFNTR